MNRSARRHMYEDAIPATSQELSDAIRDLEAFFDPRSSIWRYPVPVAIGLKLSESSYHFGILLAEYRRMRAELLRQRNVTSRLTREQAKCRKRLQPIVQALLNL